ncbi:MAG: hypothetical protein ACYS0D_04850 [Planctomycetota bacterium]|jgi:hypothetical protein
MKVTVKHKIAGALCVLGLVAVGVDRVFFLPGPAAADRLPSQHYAAVERPSSSDETPEVAPVGSITTARAAIADRLDTVAQRRGFDLDRVPNAFAPPKSWLVEEVRPSSPSSRVTAEMFEARHVLTGVMAAGDGGYAIIDGRTLFIGQELDGFELISVSERSAVLVSDGERTELMLPEGGTGP